MMAMVTSCRESLSTYFAGVMAADLTLSAVTTEGGWLETALPGSLADEIAALAGVAGVGTARALSGQPYKGERIALLALSSDMFEAERAPAGWFRQGTAIDAAPALQSGDAVLVSTSLSDRFGLDRGDRIELSGPRGPVAFPIVGVVPDYVSDRGYRSPFARCRRPDARIQPRGARWPARYQVAPACRDPGRHCGAP
jgi:hypothetical protein